jgi:hypothetical protein
MAFYLLGQIFQASAYTRCDMTAGVAQDELNSRVLFSLYINDMPIPSHDVKFALYADATAIIATSC